MEVEATPVVEINGNHRKEDASESFIVQPQGVDAERGVEEGPSLRDKIIKQVEYYLSDENLVRDVFLQQQLLKDETGQGNFSIKVLAGFPKMKQLTKDTIVVREALKKSPNLQVSSNGAMVRRKVPYQGPIIVQPPIESVEDPSKRMIYVSHLPKDLDKLGVLKIFTDFGIVKKLDLPMDKKLGEIRGIAFIQFETSEQAQRALKEFNQLNPTSKIKVFPYIDSKKKEPTAKEAKRTSRESKSKVAKEPIAILAPGAEDAGGGERNRGRPGFLAEVFNEYKEKASQREQNRSNSLTKNQDPAAWDADPSTAAMRPKLSYIGKNVADESTIIPTRQPIGPPPKGKGFTAGRGKPIA